MFDFTDDVGEDNIIYSTEDLMELAELAKRQLTLEEEKRRLEKELKAVDQLLQRVSGVDIPTAMDTIGMSDFLLKSGERITVKRKIKASIPKVKQAEAFSWLRSKGHDSLIKNQVTASFGKGEDAAAKDLAANLDAKGFVVDQKESVHSQTLAAFVREQLERGVDLPADLLGIFEYSITKVVKP